jgi:hypothetical protein
MPMIMFVSIVHCRGMNVSATSMFTCARHAKTVWTDISKSSLLLVFIYEMYISKVSCADIRVEGVVKRKGQWVSCASGYGEKADQKGLQEGAEQMPNSLVCLWSFSTLISGSTVHGQFSLVFLCAHIIVSSWCVLESFGLGLCDCRLNSCDPS